MSKNDRESSQYAQLGASSSKAGVHAAVGYKTGRDFFAEVLPDVSGDRSYYSLLHADGAGTKSIVAYLAFRETNNPSWFRSLAQDSLVMNLDDVACVGAFENLTLSNTIGRNRFLVGDNCVEAVVQGYREYAETLRRAGIEIELAGGETADMGDLVRTIVVDSTLFARVKRSQAVSFAAAQAGDVLIGFSNTGRATYESEDNSGIGSNGLTLARHALIAAEYAARYPEIVAPEVRQEQSYRGTTKLFDSPAPLTMSVAKALLSPTRCYAPLLKAVLQECGGEIHGICHCSGGGQTKINNFGKGLHYIKDNLFAVPAVFELIQASLSVPWREMYSVFNMGHRMELACPEGRFGSIEAIAKHFAIEAQIIGRIEHSGSAKNRLTIRSVLGEFQYE